MLNEKQMSDIRCRRAAALANSDLLRAALPYINVGNPLGELYRINDCCQWWKWDVYRPDKIMVLERVNRCKSRLCPNCLHMRSVELFNRHKELLESYLDCAYHLTLTVPNVNGDDLKDAIDRLNRGFTRLWRNHASIGQWKIIGALRSVEVSYNETLRNWHPHLHCLIITDKPVLGCELERDIDTGLYDYVRRKKVFVSRLELQAGRTWARLMGDEGNCYFTCIEPVRDAGGLWEVVKYPAKFSGFKNLSGMAFAKYYLAVLGRRLRQGYGVLFNVAAEEEPEVAGTTKEDVMKILGYEPENVHVPLSDEDYNSGFGTARMDDFNDYKKYWNYANIQINNLRECFKTEVDTPLGGSRVVNINVYL